MFLCLHFQRKSRCPTHIFCFFANTSSKIFRLSATGNFPTLRVYQNDAIRKPIFLKICFLCLLFLRKIYKNLFCFKIHTLFVLIKMRYKIENCFLKEAVAFIDDTSIFATASLHIKLFPCPLYLRPYVPVFFLIA